MNISQKQANDQLSKNAARITDQDIEEVIGRADEIKGKFVDGGPLKRFIRDAQLMVSLVQDYWKGSYREIPWWAIAAVCAALLYVLSPIDLIPDLLPVIGLLDDAMVVGACLVLVEQQLADYEAWKHRR